MDPKEVLKLNWIIVLARLAKCLSDHVKNDLDYEQMQELAKEMAHTAENTQAFLSAHTLKKPSRKTKRIGYDN